MNIRIIVCGIIQKDDMIVLGKKAKGAPPYPDVWHLPGGGVDDFSRAKQLLDAHDYDNEFFHDELKREIREEVGLDVACIKNIIPQYRAIPREGENRNKDGELTHYYFLEYLCEYASGELMALDDLAETRWVKRGDLKNYTVTQPSQEMYRELGW